MIDLQVVVDKLAQFQSSEELREFFIHEKIQGQRRRASFCPVANYISRQTGTKITAFYNICQLDEEDGHETGAKITTPGTIFEFIENFDAGLYPELEINPWPWALEER